MAVMSLQVGVTLEFWAGGWGWWGCLGGWGGCCLLPLWCPLTLSNWLAAQAARCLKFCHAEVVTLTAGKRCQSLRLFPQHFFRQKLKRYV